MTTQKKSLLSNLKTAKKAIVASNSTEEKPNVSARTTARAVARTTLRVAGKR